MSSGRNVKKWEVTPSTGRHFDALDGLRGLAILLVVASHTLYTNPTHGVGSRVAGYIFSGGWMGVPLFFVLSGFLISYPFFKGRNSDSHYWYPSGYTWRRLGKIIPPFYLSIVLFLGLCWWNFRDPAYFTSAWEWATGLANFVQTPVPFNLSYWSLIVEVQFYVVLPLLFWLTRGLAVRSTALFLFVLFFAIPIVIRQLSWPQGLYVLPTYDSLVYRETMLKLARFPCELDYFGWGICFAGIFVLLAPAREQLRPLSVLGYMGLLFMAVTLFSWGYWSEHFEIHAQPTRWGIEVGHLLPTVASFLMLFFLFDPDCWGARRLSAGWLRFTGVVSYEWFLFHGPVVAWFHEHTGASNGSVLAYAWRTGVPLALTFGFSVAVYRWFSLPILHAIRDRLKTSPNHG